MTKPKRLFHRFRHHAQVTVVSYDPGNRRLVYDPDDGAAGCSDRLQSGMDFDTSDLKPGVRLRLQYGETTKTSSSMRGGTRTIVINGHPRTYQMYTGCRCINAIAHVEPRITLLGLRAMEHMLGAEETAHHLGHFASDGSSLQVEIREKDTGRPLWMRIERGVLHAGALLMKDPLVRIDGGFVQVRCGDLPETLVTALSGRHIGALIDHPALRDEEFIIEPRNTNFGISNFHVARTVLTVTEALARLRPVESMPKAA